MKKIISLLIFGTLIAGCTTVQSNISKFHTLDPENTKKFTIAPSASQSLEATSYANLISKHLERYGWVHVARSPDVLVDFQYGIDKGEIVTSQMPIYGQTGGGVTHSSGSIFGAGGMATYSGTSYTPATFGVIGSVPVSDTIYSRIFFVTMTDLRTKKPVFEATVKSKGNSPTVAAVAPCMIKMLFDDFPGSSGSTENASIASAECDDQ